MKNAALVLAALVAFGCTKENGPATAANAATPNIENPAPSVASSVEPSPAVTLNPSPDNEKGEETDFAGTSGIVDKRPDVQGVAVLNDVRVGRHGSFDRLVFQFSGRELPGYHIEYIDKPVRSCGSGDVVPLAGDGWLQVRFSPAAAHTEEGKATVGFRSLTPKLPIILEVKSTCDFEAEVEWVAGVASPNHYRVLELKDPTRLAIDIKHRRR